MYAGPHHEDPDPRDAELLRYERERQERKRRRDRVAGRILAWAMAAAFALLAYDSGRAALDAHRAGRPWAYPAAVSAFCVLCLAGLVAWAVRRRRN